jgi:hypothetical protein
VHLAGGDADFRPHPELAAIRELGRGIAHQDRRIEPFKEPRCRGVILGQDRLGMLEP